MKQSVFTVLCAAMGLALVAWPTSRARAQDDCGTAISAEDDDNQADDDSQGDENGCGMVVADMDDENGDEVDDMNDDGTTDDDVEIDVEDTTPDGTTQVLQFHTNGSFRLTGLPTGHAKITATRVHNGVTTTRTRKTRVREQHTRRLRMRLRPAL